MDKAVLCIAHKNPEQINILIKQLLSDAAGCTDIYLHIDKKAEKIKKDIINNPHVFFIEHSHAVTWGDDSNVRMLVDAFHEIVSKGKPYDYFQICTGQDLMVRPGLDDFLQEHKGKIFIEIGKNDNYIKNLLLHPYPKCFQKDISGSPLAAAELAYTLLTRTGIVPRKKIDWDVGSLDFYTSYNWSFMPYEVLCYIDNFLSENPGFLTIYWNSRVPEDGFLGTLIRNSPYRDDVVFKEDGKRGNSLTFMKPLKGCHVVLLRKEDVEVIEESDAFLGRKFDLYEDGEAVKYFAEKLGVNL